MENDGIFSELMSWENQDFGSGINSKNKVQENKEKQENVEKERLKPSEVLLEKIRAKGFNLDQMESVLKTQTDQLVVSCAGSGKTTSLIFKILYDLKTGFATRVNQLPNGNSVRVPEKIWVCTFLKTGALELSNAYRKYARDLNQQDIESFISFSTLHAEFTRALKNYGFSRSIIDAKTNSKLLKDVVKPYQLTNAKGNSLNAEDYSNLESALVYTRNRLDGKRYNKDIYDELGISKPIIDAILRDWKAKRCTKGYVDFDDLQELIFSECYEKNNNDLREFLASRYSLIYIDEFQDTSQLQYEVLKLYFKDCRQVFVIGDDDQTIYSWRGSDHDIIVKKFSEDYHPVVSKLSVNYRCPKNILSAIIPSITKNENRLEKDLSSYKDGGVVRVMECRSYTDMTEKIADAVYSDLENHRSVAILCRVNSDGLLPALMFDKLDKFSYSLSGTGMTLDSYIGTTVLSIVRLFTERASTYVKRALNMLVWDSYGIDSLMKVCKTNKVSIWTIDEADLAYSCPSIAEMVLQWRKIREVNEMQALAHVLQHYRVSVFEKDTQFNTVMRSTILSVESLLSRFDFDSAQDFLYELEDINERLNGRIKSRSAVVQIATVHEYKGKEADSVYIWNDSEDVFPIKDAETEEEYEEERRVHYIACTRAKQISTIVYLKNKCGDFVREMDLSNAEVVEGSKNLQGVIKKNIEEDNNLKRFTQTAEEEGYYDKMADLEMGIVSPSSSYEENEFWGIE